MRGAIRIDLAVVTGRCAGDRHVPVPDAVSLIDIFNLPEISLWVLIKHSPDERPASPTLKQHRSGVG
jgi:hypothetical protein